MRRREVAGVTLGIALLMAALSGAQSEPADVGLALIDAAKRGDREGAARLLKAGADLEFREPVPSGTDGAPTPPPEDWNEDAGGTALILAAAHGNREVVALLLRNGASTEALDERGFTALMRAAHFGHGAVADALLEAGANPNAREIAAGTTALHFAARESQRDLVRRLLEAGADPNAALSNGWTPLMWAVERSDVEIVRLLLEAGADPNARTVMGQTVQQWAERRQSREILELLEAAKH